MKEKANDAPKSWFVGKRTRLNLAYMIHECTVLGPGRRTVLWLRGCAMKCAGCLAEHILARDEAAWVDVEVLAETIIKQPTVDGLTFSGGEPSEQAEALIALCDLVKGARDVSIMSYSGRDLEALRGSRDPSVRGFVDRLDILVDGPFVATKRSDLLWRGSSNQRVHFLSDRHADWAQRVDDPGEGVELRLRHDGSFFWAGVPPLDFQSRLAAAFHEMGVTLHDVKEGEVLA